MMWLMKHGQLGLVGAARRGGSAAMWRARQPRPLSTRAPPRGGQRVDEEQSKELIVIGIVVLFRRPPGALRPLGDCQLRPGSFTKVDFGHGGGPASG